VRGGDETPHQRAVPRADADPAPAHAADAQLAPIRSLRLLLSSGSALHAEERRHLRALCPDSSSTTAPRGRRHQLPHREDPEAFNDSVGRPVFG